MEIFSMLKEGLGDMPFLHAFTYNNHLVGCAAGLANVKVSEEENLVENDDYLVPEDGQIDWSIIADAFPTATYAGPLMLEVYPEDSDNLAAEDFLGVAYERAVRLGNVLG
jgi:sugar phosphate isomerase/epimerase